MDAVLCAIIAVLILAIVIQWRHYHPRNKYEVRIELTGGSVSIVEVRDWEP